MLKKIASMALGTLFVAGILTIPTNQYNRSEAHGMHHRTHRHHSSLLRCDHVRVTSRHAWLKAQPMMGSQTLGMVHWNESLWVVRDKMGHAHHWNGWWLLKRANGHRYWVHRSSVQCASGGMTMPQKATKKATSGANKPKTCMAALQCAADAAGDEAEKAKYGDMVKKVKSQMDNPLTKMAAESMCSTFESEVTKAYPQCAR